MSLNRPHHKINIEHNHDTKIKESLSNCLPLKRRLIWIRNNAQYVGFTILYILVNLGLFFSRAYQYRHTDVLHIGARACGQCLNLNCALILVFILRRAITKTRNSSLGNVLPCDRHLHFHKLTGWVTFYLSIFHTIFHLANFARIGEKTGISVWTYLWDTSLNIGWIWGLANPTGVLLMIILTVLVAFSHRCVRKSGKFEVFYFTHLLGMPFYVMLILHGPSVWKWLLVPGVAFLFETCKRIFQVTSLRGKTSVESSTCFSSYVTKLVVKRPKDFEFKAGEYIYLNIPSIAKHEWHPFTISSAPEDEEIFTVHIRAVGGWTEKVYEMFQNKSKENHSENISCFGIFPPREQKISLNGIIQDEYEKEVDLTLGRDIWARSSRYMSNLKEFNRKISVPCKTIMQGSSEFGKMDSPGILDKKKSNSLGSLVKEDRPNSQTPDSGRSSLTGSLLSLQSHGPEWTNYGFVPTERPLIEVNETETKSIPDLDTKIWLDEDRSLVQLKQEETTNLSTPVYVRVDGPYGSPSSGIFSVSHAVLIGAGIGVTPFASILQSIMHRFRDAKIPCPHCSISSCLAMPATLKKLRKVDFIWVNRDLKHFEWFLELLANLEEEQSVSGTAMEKFLRIHLYKTGDEPLQFPIPLASAIHEGRPNWDKIFSSIRSTKVGKICVHYCGPPTLEGILRRKCIKHKMEFKREMF